MLCAVALRALQDSGHSRAYKSTSPRACPLQVQPSPGGSTLPGVLGVALCDTGTFPGPLCCLQGRISTKAIVMPPIPALTRR